MREYSGFIRPRICTPCFSIVGHSVCNRVLVGVRSTRLLHLGRCEHQSETVKLQRATMLQGTTVGHCPQQVVRNVRSNYNLSDGREIDP